MIRIKFSLSFLSFFILLRCPLKMALFWRFKANLLVYDRILSVLLARNHRYKMFPAPLIALFLQGFSQI